MTRAFAGRSENASRQKKIDLPYADHAHYDHLHHGRGCRVLHVCRIEAGNTTTATSRTRGIERQGFVTLDSSSTGRRRRRIWCVWPESAPGGDTAAGFSYRLLVGWLIGLVVLVMNVAESALLPGVLELAMNTPRRSCFRSQGLRVCLQPGVMYPFVAGREDAQRNQEPQGSSTCQKAQDQRETSSRE